MDYLDHPGKPTINRKTLISGMMEDQSQGRKEV